jgi:hypothetical protein
VIKRHPKKSAAAVLVLIVLVGVAVWYYQPYRLSQQTGGLPRCDRVDILRLEENIDWDATSGFPIRPYKKFAKVLDTKTLSEPDAESIAAIWRSQTFEVPGQHHFQALCHDPVYALRFYRGNSVIFETSICFHCSNFFVTYKGEPHWWGFDTSTPAAETLLNRLRKELPDSPPSEEKNPPTESDGQQSVSQ